MIKNIKRINLQQPKAICSIRKILKDFVIPTVSRGNGGKGFTYLDDVRPDFEDIMTVLKTECDYRIVHYKEIFKEFNQHLKPETYDVCVEFKRRDNNPDPFVVQMLLWGDNASFKWTTVVIDNF
jgi:hypothetical protein